MSAPDPGRHSGIEVRQATRTVPPLIMATPSQFIRAGVPPSSSRSLRIRKLIFRDDSLDFLRLALDAVSETSIGLDGHMLDDGVNHRWLSCGTSLRALRLVANVFIQLVGIRHISTSNFTVALTWGQSLYPWQDRRLVKRKRSPQSHAVKSRHKSVVPLLDRCRQTIAQSGAAMAHHTPYLRTLVVISERFRAFCK
jgi:hypothetical protein